MLMMFASVFMTQQDISYYQQTPSAMETLRETGDEVNWGIYIGQVSPEWCTGAKIPLPELSIMNYLSSGNVGLLSMASGGSLYLKALLIAIITLILMGSLSGLMMQKKDI